MPHTVEKPSPAAAPHVMIIVTALWWKAKQLVGIRFTWFLYHTTHGSSSGYAEANPRLILLLHWECVWQCSFANQMLSRWYYVMDQILMVLLCVHNCIHFDKISNTTGWNIAPNHDTKHCCTSPLTTSSRVDNKPQIWISRSRRPVDLFHTSAFSLNFPL